MQISGGAQGKGKGSFIDTIGADLADDEKRKKLESWHRPMNFTYLYNLNYSYRAKTESIFKDRQGCYFDFFIVEDPNFDQHYLFQNLWRETLLLNHFNDERIQKVSYFGQLPNKIIFRQIEELQGMSLADYIDKRLFEWQLSPENKKINQANTE